IYFLLMPPPRSTLSPYTTLFRSGNKWRKLKYNILEALNRGASAIISFGGAYSNHLYALATFGKKAGIKTIGLIRGEELNPESSRSEEHTSELQSREKLVCRLLLE